MSNRLEPEKIPRRDFLGLAGLWSAGVAIVGSLIGMARFPKPQLLPETASRFSIGDPEEFPPGSEQIVPNRNVMIWSTQEGIAAISLICTHLGCVVAKDDKGFFCPCHGSQFDGEGNVLAGPAPRSLPWLTVARRPDGKLTVDAKQEVPAGTFYPV